jgi:hypothetical protein
MDLRPPHPKNKNMNKKTYSHFFGRAIGLCAVVMGAFLAAFVAVNIAWANPSGQPPSGSGAISVNGSNVGIGTTAPAYPLTLNNGSGETGILTIDSGTSIYLAHGGWSMGAGKFGIGNASVPTLVVSANANGGSSSGNVGIGTTAPAQKLDVNGNANVSGTLTAGAFTGTVSAGNVSLGTFGSNTGGGNYSFSGNVGIGMAAANFGLTLSGSNTLAWQSSATTYNNGEQAGISVVNGGTGYGDMAFFVGQGGSGGGTAMTIQHTGNVGIGTPGPTQKLSVAGEIIANEGVWGAGGYSFVQDGAQDTGMFSPSDGVIDFYNNQNHSINISAGGVVKFYQGIVFPDGTTQSTAAATGATYSAGTGIVQSGNTFGVDTATWDNLTNRASSNAGSGSGFYQSVNASAANGWPTGATSWWHLINAQHTNGTNNYAMQIAGSFYDQNIYFRKTNGSGTQAWSQFITSGNIGSQSVNYANSAGNANQLIGKNWNWAGQGGQPTWLWGGSDGTNMYVYNPSNFSVNYANSAGSANNVAAGNVSAGTLDGNFTFSGATTFNNSVNMGSNKLTVGTIDPVYSINGTNYATYGASMTGVNEETAGTLTLVRSADGTYAKTIDFGAQATGSDLWLFAHATELTDASNLSKLVVILTPSFDGRVWYKKNTAAGTLTIYSDQAGEVSYRFTAPRFDASKWSNTAPAGETASFTVK